ncbi:MAG: exo-alpha-sialidase [Armatimonadetes bacterium]|nr:exo-alpha-sialidase [Armatimonadota bacterium]
MQHTITGWPMVTIAREEGVYACFPDLARTGDGRLLCVYRQSDSHVAEAFSHLAWRESVDEGRTWSEPRLLAESRQESGVLFKWNCPRIGTLPDGRLWILCDGYPLPPGERDLGGSRVFFWWSRDEGQTWGGPERTPITGIVPDKLCLAPSGDWLVAAHVAISRTGKLKQALWRSGDEGRTWSGPITVCDDERYNACEASLTALPGGSLVCYMRENSGLGWPGLKCLSRDGGLSWQGPFPTLMPGCHRPVSGLVDESRVLIAHRCYPGGRSPNRHFFACLESAESAAEPELSRQSATLREIDRDRSPHPDTGYSGWAVLPDRRIFCVNYIVDDFATAQIRGYWLQTDRF